MSPNFDVAAVRSRFPAFERRVGGTPAAYFDGPAGSQVPRSVAEAVSRYLLGTNANHGAPFATSVESDRLLDDAHAAFADFFGTPDADCIAFGANMTTITLALSRALGRTWQPGDEVIVTRLDHDANVTPWMLAARDAGAVVKQVDLRPDDCTLDVDGYRSQLSDRTRLVAVGYASNATGTINPLPEMISAAHAVGAEVFVDAVHYAPHGSIDVTALDCEYLVASAYKFFGPHVGVLYGKRERLESLRPYKLRPSPDELPGRWMTGTQNHEGICGAEAAVEYLAELGRSVDPQADGRRGVLEAAFTAIGAYERELLSPLMAGLREIPGVKIWGITDESRFAERVPTVSFTHPDRTPQQIAAFLAERGLFVWAGNHYALPFTEAMGLEPHGTCRIGLLHYNTAEEVERLLTALRELLGG